MGRSFLRLGKREFWRMTPRKLLDMIDAWKDVTKTQAYFFAMLNNGQPIPDDKPKKIAPMNNSAFYIM
jgi:hypothetical protein